MFTRFLRIMTAVTLAWVLAASAGDALAALKDKGPINQFGFPTWYRDTTRLPLQQCVSNVVSPDPRAVGAFMCAVTMISAPFPLQEPSFNAALPLSNALVPITGGVQAFSNWPLEAFYFQASAPKTFQIVGSKATLIEFGVESAFSGASPIPGDQIAFSRVRIRLLNVPQGIYTIRHPYGVEVLAALPDGVGGFDVNFTRDIGLIDPVPFGGALKGDIGPFLRWTVENPRVYAATNPNVVLGQDGLIAITQPDGTVEKFIGDPSIEHTYTGSPLLPAYNRIRIEGPLGSIINPNIAAPDRSVMETDLLAIEGRLWTAPIPTTVVVERATYARSAAGGHVDLFASADAVSNLDTPSNLTATYAGLVTPVVLAKTVNGATASFYTSLPIADPALLPTTITLTNTADQVAPPASPLAVNAAVVDEVHITRADYDPRTKALTIQADSSDRLSPPALVATGFGPLVVGSLTVPALNVYPPKVSVISASGGVAAAEVAVRETVLVSASAGLGGGIFPSGSIPVVRGEDQIFSIVADPGFIIANVLVDGLAQGAIASFTLRGVITTHTISATFTALYPLSVVKIGSGLVTSDVGGITCGAVCSATYPSGTLVTLTAAVDPIFPGFEFTGWSGACTVTGTGSCIVTMDAAKNVSATFIHYTVKLLGIIPLPDKRYVTLGNNYTLDIPVGTTNATLMVQTSTFNEFLTYSLPLTLTINGGKGIDFVTDTGYTVINGSLFIRAGRMNVNKVKIQPRII